MKFTIPNIINTKSVLINSKHIKTLVIAPIVEPMSSINDFPCTIHNVLYVSYG